ncbi:hypothetical protein ACWDU8_02925 [Streptomyces sp. NPDC003388]|uniref:hypothetical protein n=1 Tax=unclassified Streptomyces TaxID=2593676 RepID=UPI0033E12C4D
MAKNKNRKQGGPQNRASQPEHSAERAQRPAAEEPESSMAGAAGSPSDASRKKQKSFGHN